MKTFGEMSYDERSYYMQYLSVEIQKQMTNGANFILIVFDKSTGVLRYASDAPKLMVPMMMTEAAILAAKDDGANP